MKLISLIILAITTAFIFFIFSIFFVGSEKEVKTRLWPDNAHIRSSIYFMYNVYIKFYSSRCVVIYVCMLFIWKPQLLLHLIGLIFWGKKIFIQTEVKVLLELIENI